MGMYENLIRLVMTGDTEKEVDDLREWAFAMATATTERYEVSLEVLAHATACMCVGFQFGIAYGREYGIPDSAKDLITLKG